MADSPASAAGPNVRAAESAVIALGAVGLTALAGAFLLLAGGYDPLAAVAAMLRGAFGSWGTFTSITLVRSVPLILTGLAVALAFRAGVWNIGAEGQLYAGAIAAAGVGLVGVSLPGVILLPAVLLAAFAGGALWAVVPTLMRVRLGVGEVITTILMNFVGIYLAAWMVHGPMQESRGVFPQTDPIADAARISGRIDADRVLVMSFIASGAIAGLAGGVEVSGLTFALYEDLSPGWGYTAIAVALLAGLDPRGVIVTGLLFGALQAGAGAMQRDAGIPAAWVGVVEALVILAVLALDRVRRIRARAS